MQQSLEEVLLDTATQSFVFFDLTAEEAEDAKQIEPVLEVAASTDFGEKRRERRTCELAIGALSSQDGRHETAQASLRTRLREHERKERFGLRVAQDDHRGVSLESVVGIQMLGDLLERSLRQLETRQRLEGSPTDERVPILQGTRE